MWIHSLTKEVTALRPPEYVDEQALEEGGEEEDVAGESMRRRWQSRQLRLMQQRQYSNQQYFTHVVNSSTDQVEN